MIYTRYYFGICVGLLFYLGLALSSGCKQSNSKPRAINKVITDSIIQIAKPTNIYFDSLLLDSFFYAYPATRQYKKPMRDFYSARRWQYVWYDAKGLGEAAYGLAAHLISDSSESAVGETVKQKLDSLLHEDEVHQSLKPDFRVEGLLTVLYFRYVEKVLAGVDENVSRKLGWMIPRRKLFLPALLDSFLLAKNWDDFEQGAINVQYFALKKVLEKYKAIDASGMEIRLPAFSGKALKPGDTAVYMGLLRKRLVQLGYAGVLTDTNAYTSEMVPVINMAKKAYGFKEDGLISRELYQELQVPVAKRERQLLVNMERMRWVPARFESDVFILVNIPDFKLIYFENGSPTWTCNVVVGTPANKTVIFSGVMDYVVFSPYWYVPNSIITKEIGLSRAKSAAYLKRKNMEWVGGQLREKPGPNNSLGLVKFIFPNSNSIYLHDTPSKSLFEKDTRAFSHGCIRVQKPFDLAKKVLSYDSSWTDEKIRAAMNAGVEKKVVLQRKIPVYVGYFTAFSDEQGLVHFRKDVYGRDGELLQMLAGGMD